MGKKLGFILCLLVLVATGANFVQAQSNVAKIGNKNYTSIETAVSEAKSGDTITLLANTSIDSLVLKSGITLDIPSNITLTVTGNSVAESGGIVKNNGLINVTGSLDISKLAYGANGLVPNQDGLITIGSNGKVTMLDAWVGWKPALDSAVLTNIQNGAKIIAGEVTYEYQSDWFKLINKASEPKFDTDNNIFVANGTDIVIKEIEGSTYVTWGENRQLVDSKTIVIGGYYNPCTTNCIIDLDKINVTMENGTIGYLTGGNVITTDYALYGRIHVGTINMTINGGNLKQISAVSAATKRDNVSVLNVVVPSAKYDQITSYYYADSVNITVNNAKVTERLYISSSYTYAKDVVVNINNSTIDKGYYSLAVGTNGKVTNFTVNVKDSAVEAIHSGFRAMVDKMVVTIEGQSTIGDIYAGSYYGIGEKFEDWKNLGIGKVDYGQVGEIEINLGKDVVYNNVYAGFQFDEKELFYNHFAGNEALNTVAKGIENSENAPVVINTYSVPKVTDSSLTSMFTLKADNIEINYLTETNIQPLDVGAKVVEPTIGLTEEADKILNEEIKNNEKVIEALAAGQSAKVEVEMEIVEPTEEIKTKISELAKDNTIIEYFDINVLITSNGLEIDKLTEISEEIEFIILLPEALKGENREYYIIREHEGNVDTIKATLSEDGSYVTFKTNKFSVYALTYTAVTNPNTGDNVVLYIVLGMTALLGLSAIAVVSKKTKKC